MKEDLSLTDKTYDAILNMILNGTLPAGERVQERRLAEMLDLSRTPVREALGRLEMEGLILRQNRVSIVHSISVSEFVSILHVRRLLEAEAASLACTRIPSEEIKRLRENAESVSAGQGLDPQTFDNDLHDTILFYSGNEVLAAIVKQLRKKTAIFNIRRIPRRAAPVAGEHMAIIGALERRDQAGVRTAVTVHIDNVRESIIAWISNIGSDSAR